MTVTPQADKQVSMALDAIQSKRRMERVLEAANALLDRYSARPAAADRLATCYELVRRNFSPEVILAYGGVQFGDHESFSGLSQSTADSEATSDHREVFRVTLVGADGSTGVMAARYSAAGPVGLSADEWFGAMKLIAGLLGLSLGGKAECE